jgi:hypothetical protein
MKPFQKYSLFLILVVYIVGAIDIIVSIRKGNREYLNREFHGVISNIRIQENSRGLPDIKIGEDWIDLNIPEQKISRYVCVGDSVLKECGKSEIVVFRKNSDQKWVGKVFK